MELDTTHTQFLRRTPAGKYLLERFGFGAPKTLAKLAVTGGGPKFRMAGVIPLYLRGDLDDWAQSRIGPAFARLPKPR
jgi:hypothetical protein